MRALCKRQREREGPATTTGKQVKERETLMEGRISCCCNLLSFGRGNDTSHVRQSNNNNDDRQEIRLKAHGLGSREDDDAAVVAAAAVVVVGDPAAR